MKSLPNPGVIQELMERVKKDLTDNPGQWSRAQKAVAKAPSAVQCIEQGIYSLLSDPVTFGTALIAIGWFAAEESHGTPADDLGAS